MVSGAISIAIYYYIYIIYADMLPRSAGYLQIAQDRLELVLASLIAVAGYVQIAQNVLQLVLSLNSYRG